MERLERFPFIMVFLAYAAYLGYQYYLFNYDPSGSIATQKIRIGQMQEELVRQKKKLEEGQAFVEKLEMKKAEIQQMAKKLEDFKVTLNDSLDMPALLKLLVTEAKKVGMKVDKIEPGRKESKDYYMEQEFRLDVRATYLQVIIYAQRLSQLDRILRIGSYSIKSKASSSARNLPLDVRLSVRAYQYQMSKEDKMMGATDVKK